MVKDGNQGPTLLHLIHRKRATNNYKTSSDPNSPGRAGSPQARFNQNYFPQPTRPNNVLSPKPPCTPPYRALPYQTWTAPSTTTGLIQSPNSSRPTNIYNIGYPYYVPESWFQPGINHSTNQPEESNQLGEGYDEIIRRIMELYEKLPDSVREKVSLELIRNRHSPSGTTGQKGLNVDSSTTGSRGLRQGVVEEEESSVQLERFKIKTINLGGIVKEDDDKPSK